MRARRSTRTEAFEQRSSSSPSPFKDRFSDVPKEYRGRGCPSVFVAGRDYYGEWLAWQIDLAKERVRG